VSLFRWLALREHWLLATLAFPATWVSFEFLNTSTSPHSTFGSVAYSQMNFLPILQVASLTGIWGIGFCLFLFPVAVALFLITKNSRSRATAYAALVVLVGILGWGAWRLHAAPAGSTVLVGLLASDAKQNVFTENPEDTQRLLSEYAEEATKLAAQDAELIIAPEKIGVVPDADIKRMDAVFTDVSGRTKAVIVAGVVHPTSGPDWNEARIYSGDSVHVYEKHHMLPAFESQFTVGTERTLLEEPSGRWGVSICKDMDFPKLSRQYGNDGIGLLLVPAWDFNVDGWLHGRMAILRGVESGFSIARAPKQGILTITDNRGRVLAEAATNSAPFATLLARVPVQHESTLYARWGDWFAWANVALLIILLVIAFTQRTRAPKSR
jgi:apolipoprotein N-acyltransferase